MCFPSFDWTDHFVSSTEMAQEGGPNKWMATNKNLNPSCSSLQIIFSSTSDSHQVHPEHTIFPSEYIVNTPSQFRTHCIPAHPETSFSSSQPRALTISDIEAIVRHSTEWTNHALTRTISLILLSSWKSGIPLTYGSLFFQPRLLSRKLFDWEPRISHSWRHFWFPRGFII